MRWDDYTSGLSSDDAALMDAFRELTNGLTESTEHVNKSEVRFKRHRTYAIAFTKAHRLEVAINLLRDVEHPLLRDRSSSRGLATQRHRTRKKSGSARRCL